MWIFYTGANPIIRLAGVFLLCGAAVGAVVWIVLRRTQ
jgi:hypothetical protein